MTSAERELLLLLAHEVTRTHPIADAVELVVKM